MSIPRQSLLLLLVLWVVAAVIIFWVRSVRPTPEKLTAYLQKNAVEELQGPRREDVINETARQLNRLDFEQRRALREDGELREFFEALAPEERRNFLDQTVPEGFRQMMLALNKMEPERRRKLVERALEDLRTESPRQAERIEEAEVQKIIAQGLGTFYDEASAEVKMDFAPVLEELQRNLQNLR